MPPIKPPPQEAEPEKDDAEPVKPPPRPKPPEKTEIKPVPKPPEKPTPKVAEKPVEKPAPKEAPKETPKPPKLDEVAKLLAENKDKPTPNPTPKPKSGEENTERRPSPDLAEISRLLSREAPSSVGSAGRDLNRTASLGAPNASAARMSPSMSGELNFLMQEQYKQCWSLPPTNGPRYVAKIHITYRPDGSLAAQPVLINPPSDLQSHSLADSALRAVRRCNPLKIPARFQPYFEQWKDWVVGFDPDNM
jgi:colicin import membrane protein